jgi:hypothetical protein
MNRANIHHKGSLPFKFHTNIIRNQNITIIYFSFMEPHSINHLC